MKFEKFAEWAFYAIISGTCVTGVAILTRLTETVNKLAVEVATGNEANKWIIKNLDNHELRIIKCEEKILNK